MIKRNSYILIFITLRLTTSIAQDYHFSQFDANPFFINPAITGERLTENKGAQFNVNYRDQMSKYTAAPGSFKNVAFGADETINSKFSIGQYIYNNKAASGSLNTFGFMLSGAHHLIDQKKENGNHNLSLGLQVGVFNRSVKPENFTYDSQYSSESPDGFDRTIPNGESYASQSDFNFNFNFGVYYRVSSKNAKLSGFGGLSVYNLAQPNESYLDGYEALPIRINLHGGAICSLNKLLRVQPQFLYMNQAQANELNINMLFFSKFEGSSYEPIYGLGFRNKDAVIVQAGLNYKNATFRISYDIVTNATKEYKNRGLEFSLMYTLTKKPKTETPAENVVPSSLNTQP